jgi:hypothetical protein
MGYQQQYGRAKMDRNSLSGTWRWMAYQGSGGGSHSVTSPRTKSLLEPEQKSLMNQLLGYSSGDISGLPARYQSGQFPTFNEQAPGASALESLSLAGMESIAGGKGNPMGAASGSNDARSRLTGLVNQGPQSIDDYFNQNVRDPAFRDYAEVGLPGLRGQAVGGGNLFSGQQRETESRSARDVFNTVEQARSAAAFGEKNRNDQTAIQAIGQLIGLNESDISQLTSLLSAGAVPRNIETNQMQSRLDSFNREIQERDKKLALAQSLSYTPTRALGEKVISNSINMGAGLCWCAAVYFGWYTPDWWRARNWIVAGWRGPVAWLVRRIYPRVGVRLAIVLRSHRWLRKIVAPFFIWAAKQGGK